MDSNKDGVISVEEFMDTCRQVGNCMQQLDYLLLVATGTLPSSLGVLQCCWLNIAWKILYIAELWYICEKNCSNHYVYRA